MTSIAAQEANVLAKFLLIPIPLGRVGLVLAAVVLVVWLIRRQRR
jgi:hypothetical protein